MAKRLGGCGIALPRAHRIERNVDLKREAVRLGARHWQEERPVSARADDLAGSGERYGSGHREGM
ncbi:hypothetical protein [Paraburkholderia hospita]|uniref:hypothetical protein n=1 Tax=Paraburkholderia hospita TaxID=169430 RepID=UPI003F500293